MGPDPRCVFRAANSTKKEGKHALIIETNPMLLAVSRRGIESTGLCGTGRGGNAKSRELLLRARWDRFHGEGLVSGSIHARQSIWLRGRVFLCMRWRGIRSTRSCEAPFPAGRGKVARELRG